MYVTLVLSIILLLTTLLVILTKSLSSTTVASIITILDSERKPQSMKQPLITDIKCRIENLSHWSKLIFLRRCLSSSLATKQIQDLARRTVSKLGAKSRQFSEERPILRMRILLISSANSAKFPIWFDRRSTSTKSELKLRRKARQIQQRSRSGR